MRMTFVPSYRTLDRVGNEGQMNDLDRYHPHVERRARLRLGAAGGLVLLLIATSMCLAGAAFAGTSTKAGPHAGSVTAAQDQYGEKQVLKPAPVHTLGTSVKKVTTSPAATAAPLASPAQTLPYTGLALFKVMLIGLGLVVLGFAIRRWPRTRNGE